MLSSGQGVAIAPKLTEAMIICTGPNQGWKISEKLVAIGSSWKRKHQSSLKDVTADRIPCSGG